MSVVDVASGAVVGRVPVGREPEGVGITPDGRWVLVTNESDNSVSVIDTRTLKIVKSVQVGKRPRDVAFTPDGRAAYVSGEFDASRVSHGRAARRARGARAATAQGSAPDGGRARLAARSRLYVSTGRGGTVAVDRQREADKLLAEVPVGTRPWGIALSQDGRWLYTANGPSNDVSVDRYLDAACGSSTFPSDARRGASWSGPSRPQKARDGSSCLELQRAQPAAAVRLGLDFPIALRHLPCLLGVAEDSAAFAGQAGVLCVRRSFDEVVVAQAVRDPIDGARALVQVRELAAVLRDAFIHELDARDASGSRVTGGSRAGPAVAEAHSKAAASRARRVGSWHRRCIVIG